MSAGKLENCNSRHRERKRFPETDHFGKNCALLLARVLAKNPNYILIIIESSQHFGGKNFRVIRVSIRRELNAKLELDQCRLISNILGSHTVLEQQSDLLKDPVTAEK